MERFRSAITAETTETHENQPEKKIRGRPIAPGNPGGPPGSKDPIQLLEKLGRSPVLKNENKALYKELFNTVWSDVGPTDIIEQLWVRDVVDDTWTIFRWRRLGKMIGPRMFGSVTEISFDSWFDNHQEKTQVSKNQVFSEVAKRVQCIERLITNAVQRRNATLREIERRRFMFAQQLRKSVDKADVQVLEPKLRATKSS
jgi:hypothetical protein